MNDLKIYTSPEPIAWKGEGAMDKCFHCGRKISGRGYWVNSADGDLLAPISATESQIRDAGYYPMGSFPVGSTCAKLLKIPSGYLTEGE